MREELTKNLCGKDIETMDGFYSSPPNCLLLPPYSDMNMHTCIQPAYQEGTGLPTKRKLWVAVESDYILDLEGMKAIIMPK